MESPPPLSCYLSKNSKKSALIGTSSACMEGADMVEIPPPVNVNSNSKQSKEKEVFYPDVIDVDDDHETWPEMKADTSDKGKTTSAHCSSAGFHHYEAGNQVKSSESSDVKVSNNLYEEFRNIIDVDNEYMGFSSNQSGDDRYARLQSHFDDLNVPPGIEVPVPWFMDDKVNTMGSSTSTTVSDSHIKQLNHVGPSLSLWLGDEHVKDKLDVLPSIGTLLQSSSSNGSSKYSTKPASPYDKYLSGSAKLSTKLEAPKASSLWESSSELKRKLLTRHHKLRSGSKSKYSSSSSNATSDVHKALTSVEFVRFPHDLGLSLGLGSNEGGMETTNVDSILKFEDWGDPSITTAHQFSDVSDSMELTFSTFDDPLAYTSMGSEVIMFDDSYSGNSSSAAAAPSSCTRVYDDPEAILKKFDLFKRFDTVEDHSDHLFSNHDLVTQPSKGWAKKIQDEWRILEKDLPDTIFVRVYESRMDLLRAVIIGAEETPYHDGLFFFDMFFPQNYPNVPPHVKYHSGGLRINPNLYNCGKVCLSLLNTWSGSKQEMWTPGVSTVLQILVSIQGLILNAKPYFNEPGYAGSSGTPMGEIASMHYNETTLIYSLKTMVYSIRKPPKHFEDLVAGHFLKRAEDILVACKAYLNGAQVGCLVKGGVQDVEAGDKSCSDGFKKDLATFLKTLVNTFAHVGVKDCDKFLKEIQCFPTLQLISGRQGCGGLQSFNV